MKVKRVATNEMIKSEMEHHRFFTFSQVEDIVKLLANKQYPDARFSDAECNLWEMIGRELNIQN